MTILSNIENEVIELRTLICNEVKACRKELKEIDVGTIDIDYVLIRHLCRELQLKDININNSGYATIKRRDNTTTTLHRFILEFYSQFNEELKEILENKEYEINHKNKDKLDNRIENLEIVTHKNNIRHSKGLDYEVAFETSKLKKIQEISLNSKQQEIDKAFLKRVSCLLYKIMNNIREKKIKNKLLKYCYLEFKNNIKTNNNNEQNSNDINKKREYKTYKLMTNFHTKKLKRLLQKKKEYIYKTIVDNNINLLNRYIVRYPYIEESLKKYKLVDKDFKDKLEFDKSNSRNILLDFYEDIYNSNKYIIKDGNILLTVTIKYFFNVKGRYKSFLTLYLLGLLQRQNDISKPNIMTNRYIHTPSFIRIPVYTDNLLKETNKQAKDLLELNLNRLTYFIVAQEFGEEEADFIYKNKQCKANYKYGLRAKEDIINFLKTDIDIHTIGFITRQDIFDQIQGLNSRRKLKRRKL